VTDQQHRVLANYIRFAADELGLRDWFFFLHKGPPTREHNLAQTEVWGDSKTTEVWFAPAFFNLGPRMQVELVCHELLHWHTDQMDRLVGSVMSGHLSREAAEVMRTAFGQRMEFVIDGIAQAFSRKLPVINWRSRAKPYTEMQPIPRTVDGDVIVPD
jgi:hypothetical protein